MLAIKTNNISKNYGDINALQDISFEVAAGKIMGLIGPDGAGKSTLFKILTTVLLPARGSAAVADLDIIKDFRKIRKRIGYMPERFSLYQDLTIAENINFFATIFGTTLQKNYDLIREIYEQLEPFKNRAAGKLSGGMKQKLALCCALIHQPQILFLDEPTTGVDAVSRKEFWQMLKRLQQKNITILVSTPYMDEAAQCDDILLMQKGKILETASPSTIKNLFHGKLLAIRAKKMYELLLALRNHPSVENCYAFGEYLNVTLRKNNNDWHTLKNDLQQQGFDDVEIKEITPGIENVFMQLLAQNENAGSN